MRKPEKSWGVQGNHPYVVGTDTNAGAELSDNDLEHVVGGLIRPVIFFAADSPSDSMLAGGTSVQAE